MNIKLLSFLSAVVLAILAYLYIQKPSIIKIDGSSTVFPVSDAVVTGFKRANRSAKVMLGISGTGGGFKKFCNGTIDIANASRPILAKEIAQCKASGIEFIELPFAFDALTVVVNPKNTWASSLSVDQLKLIWDSTSQSKVMNWQQVDSSFPDSLLGLYGSSSDSGTFDYFSEALNIKSKSTRGDYQVAEEAHETANSVARDINGIGYVGFADYEDHQQKLKAVEISWKGSEPVSPSIEHVLNGSYQPFSRPLMIYVNISSLKKLEVSAFVKYFIENSRKYVQQVKYVALPDEAYATLESRVKNQAIGTVFSGKNQIGITIEDLIKRQPQR
jgi:phosphate transport system substrate-binding protein